MKIIFTNILLIAIVSISFAQNKPAYQLFNSNGDPAKYQEMVVDLANSDMVFFGEYHDNPISHWLQLEMCKSFYQIKGEELFFGAEMFESGNQLVIDEYLQDFYTEAKMMPEITQMWNNYKTDYKPLLDFAKENDLRFIATNIPRRYANMIYKKGIAALDMLSKDALNLIAPDFEKLYDPEQKAYAEMGGAMGGHVPPNMDNIKMAQAIKDATMAYFSLENYKKGNLLLHFQGAYHSNYNQGIIWWVNQYKPGLEIKSITTVLQSEWDVMTAEEKVTIANYIIVVADNIG